MRRLALSFLFILPFGLLHAQEPFRSAGDRPVDIKHIRLDLKVDLPKKTIEGQATLRLRT